MSTHDAKRSPFRPRDGDGLYAALIALFERSDDAMLVLDAADRVVGLNPAAGRLVGRDPAEATGLALTDVFAASPALLAHLRQPGQQGGEFSFADALGPRGFTLQISVLTDRRGRAAGRLLILHDVTTERQSAVALHKAHDELEALYRVSIGLTSNLDIVAVLDVVLRSAFELLPNLFDVHIFLYLAGRLHFVASLFTDGRKNVLVAEPRPEGMTYRVARSGEPIVVPNIQQHALYKNAPHAWQGALAGIPLKIGRRVVGVMNVAYAQPRDFPDDELRLLRLLGDQAAIAIENARLYGQAQEELRERKRAEAAISKLNEELEGRVAQRTAELSRTNAALQREVAERKNAEDALRESESRYALAARGANDGLWDWDIASNRIYYSPRWKAMLGHQESDIGDSPDEWFGRVHPADLAGLRADLSAHLEGRSTHFEHEHRMRHNDGVYRWMLTRGIATRDADGKRLRIAGSQTDISRRKIAEERLLYDALHEPLTGLPNRALFADRLNQLLRVGVRRTPRKAAVLFLDLDRFKVVNDSLGHLVGDRLLIEIARRLESCVRPLDTVARFGGDEFGILLVDLVNDADATLTAERVLHELSAPFDIEGNALTVSASIGIALVHKAGSTGRLYQKPDEILRDADTAMYRAKTEGRSRHAVFRAGMHAHAVALLQTEADLRQAIERQEFELYYQPIVTVSTQKITCVEALVRWRHPQRGLVPPGEFISVAEESGLIVRLGAWILRAACRQIAAWHAVGYPQLRVAVNFSARQFLDPEMPALVRGALAESGLAGSALEIEITESTAMGNVELSARTLAVLHELGVHLSIDDFGNSYSTLGHLRRFPFQTLKIDQTFLRDVSHDVGNAAITTAITAMARSLKLRVVAEGIETEDQLAFMRGQQCDEAQGYLFSHPLPAGELTDWLRENARLPDALPLP